MGEERLRATAHAPGTEARQGRDTGLPRSAPDIGAAGRGPVHEGPPAARPGRSPAVCTDTKITSQQAARYLWPELSGLKTRSKLRGIKTEENEKAPPDICRKGPH